MLPHNNNDSNNNNKLHILLFKKLLKNKTKTIKDQEKKQVESLRKLN